MTYFYSIYPDQNSVYKIRSLLGDVGKIFDSHAIPIHYSDRDSYNIKLFDMGSSYPLWLRLWHSMRLKGFKQGSFELELKAVRLGTSTKNRELLYISVGENEERLRKIVYDLGSSLDRNRGHKFNPVVPLGRVVKDLSDEEYKNLSSTIASFNENNTHFPIRFVVNEFVLTRKGKNDSTQLKNFRI